MPWAAAGAVAGAGISAYGANNAADTGQNPAGMIQRETEANNPDTNTYFGGTRLIRDPGLKISGEDAWKDDTFSKEQIMSPQMTALSDMLMGRAGAGRGTFDSGGMPDHMKNMYADKMAGIHGGNSSDYMPREASFDRPEFGFDIGDGPAQVQAPEEMDLTGMTNMDAYQMAVDSGELSRSDIEGLNKLLTGSNSFSGRNTLITGDGREKWDNLGEGNQYRLNKLATVLAPYVGGNGGPNNATVNAPPGWAAEAQATEAQAQQPPAQQPPQGMGVNYPQEGEPDPSGYDQAALQRLIQSLTGAS